MTANILRAADVRTRRTVRNAMTAWATLVIRTTMALTGLACRLSRSRKTQDAALYAVSAVAVCVVVSGL